MAKIQLLTEPSQITKRAHLIHQEMHEKYGDVIRIGPNTVIFSNPEAIPTVYVTKPGFIKVKVPYPSELVWTLLILFCGHIG